MRKKYILVSIIILLIALVLTGCSKKEDIIEENKYKIVTSFYPMYTIARNLTDGIDTVSVENMTDTNVVCLHNYTLQASDLKKLSNANMFILNGFGIEAFDDKIKKEYEDITIVDTSKIELQTIEDSGEINGHVWNSIDNYISQVDDVLDNLCIENLENTDKYKKNAEIYMKELNKLKNEAYVAKSGTVVVSCNEALAYILKDAKLDVIEVYTDHEQSALSSKELNKIINEIKEKNVKVIFVEKNDDKKTAQIIANETGAKIYELDAMLKGDMEKDSYIRNMENNYKILKDCLE